MDRRTEELAECQRVWPRGQMVCHGPREEWSSFGFAVYHQGYWVTARFHPSHPYYAPLVYISPEPVSRHYYAPAGETAARLCYLGPGEWTSRFRLNVALCCGLRFINDYCAGLPSAR